MKELPNDFKNLNEETAKEIALIESFKRKDLNSIEEVLKSKEINTNVLKILSQSKSYHIRRLVMLAENTPQEILDLLLKDEQAIVRNAFEFRKLPTKLKYLKGSGGIINYIMDNPQEKVLEIFANWSDSKVRECVAKDNNTPIKILNNLIDDNDANVSTSAKETAYFVVSNTPIEILNKLINEIDVATSIKEIIKDIKKERITNQTEKSTNISKQILTETELKILKEYFDWQSAAQDDVWSSKLWDVEDEELDDEANQESVIIWSKARYSEGDDGEENKYEICVELRQYDEDGEVYGEDEYIDSFTVSLGSSKEDLEILDDAMNSFLDNGGTREDIKDRLSFLSEGSVMRSWVKNSLERNNEN